MKSIGIASGVGIVYLEETFGLDGTLEFEKRRLPLTRVWFDPKDHKARAKFVSAVLGRPLSQVDDEHFTFWYHIDDGGRAFAAVSWYRPNDAR